MIINKTYFKGLTEIANANDSAPLSDKVGNSVVLDVMIKKYEPLLLIKLLGYDLYKLLTDQFDKTNNDWVLKTGNDLVLNPGVVLRRGQFDNTNNDLVLNTGVEQKWKDLVKGAEVVYDGVTYKWDGLANGEDSLIADFIYSKYIEELEIQHTGIGLVQEKAEKAERVNGRTKIIDAYNQFYYKAIENDTHTYLSLYDYIKYQNDVNGQDYYPKWLPSFTFELKNRYI